jgi:hypothetical protein
LLLECFGPAVVVGKTRAGGEEHLNRRMRRDRHADEIFRVASTERADGGGKTRVAPESIRQSFDQAVGVGVIPQHQTLWRLFRTSGEREQRGGENRGQDELHSADLGFPEAEISGTVFIVICGASLIDAGFPPI